jgi:D-3-phosphoglycerate dehydrogenase
MINASFFNQFRNDIFLINTSRGEIIEEADLLLGLNAGKIKGACLDVFENEKTNLYTDKDREFYNELFRRQNIVLSPHVAGWTMESKRRHAEILLNRICNNSDYI